MSAAEHQTQREEARAEDRPREDRDHAEEGRARGDKAKKPEHPRRRWIVRIVLILAGCILLIAGGIWVLRWWTHGRFIQSTNDAFLKADKVTVSARTSGLVEQVLVSDNETVRVGQPLLRLDDRDARAKREQAVAQADQARASIAEGRAQIRQQEAQIAQAQAQLDGTKSQLAFADREAARYAKLAAAGGETRESYEQKRQSRDQARAQMAHDAAAVLAARRQIATTQAQIIEAEAKIEQAQAAGRQADVDLDAAILHSRIDGRVGDKTVQAGQYVQTGTQLMAIVPVQDLYLIANFKETQLREMRVGQDATISVDALGSRELHGRIESFAPGTGSEFALIPPENATGNFTKVVQRVGVRIHLDPDEHASAILVPGLSVTAAVDTTSAAAPERVHDASKPTEVSAPARSTPSTP